MPANPRSQDDQLEFGVRRRRRRLAVHAAVFSAAGMAALTMGSASTSAAPTVQDGRYLAGTSTTITYTCMGADQATEDILAIFDLTPFPMPMTITSSSVEPSPSPGESFEVDFTWDNTIDPAIEAFAYNFGITSLDISDGVHPISATAGATGDSVGNGTPTSVIIGDGSVPIGYTQGPFTGTFTRTAEVDEPIEFTPGSITSTVVASSQGVPGSTLRISCSPGEGVLTMQDQDGVAPSTTTTTRPIVTTTAPTTTTTVAVAGVQQLPRTGSGSNLMLVLLALGLIDLGYLAWSAGQTPRAQRTPSGR